MPIATTCYGSSEASSASTTAAFILLAVLARVELRWTRTASVGIDNPARPGQQRHAQCLVPPRALWNFASEVRHDELGR